VIRYREIRLLYQGASFAMPVEVERPLTPAKHTTSPEPMANDEEWVERLRPSSDRKTGLVMRGKS
jgi:hypothetical protein